MSDGTRRVIETSVLEKIQRLPHRVFVFGDEGVIGGTVMKSAMPVSLCFFDGHRSVVRAMRASTTSSPDVGCSG